MKKYLNTYKYAALLLLYQLFGVLMAHYHAAPIWYAITGTLAGIIGAIIAHKKINL